MTGIPVVVGAALYSFPNEAAVLAFLAERVSGGSIDPTVDPKKHGATFECRAPWCAETVQDCAELTQIMQTHQRYSTR